MPSHDPQIEPFYASSAWKDCRESYKKFVGGLCEECLKKGIYTPGEIVHHITPISAKNVYNPEITLSFSNLKLVCRQCHGKEHERTKKSYRINPDGTLTEK